MFTNPAIGMSDGMQHSDVMIVCGVLVLICVLAIVVISLVYCPCRCKKRKSIFSRRNSYALPLTERDDVETSDVPRVNTPVGPSVRVTTCYQGSSFYRSPSFEVRSNSNQDLHGVSDSTQAVDSDWTVGIHTAQVENKPIKKSPSLLSYFRQKVNNYGKDKMVSSSNDGSTVGCNVNSELEESSIECMLHKFDSLVLSVQWSDVTAESDVVDDQTQTNATIELVDKDVATSEQNQSRASDTMKLLISTNGECDPSLISPDVVFSCKSSDSEHSYFSLHDHDKHSFNDSDIDIFKSIS